MKLSRQVKTILSSLASVPSHGHCALPIRQDLRSLINAESSSCCLSHLGLSLASFQKPHWCQHVKEGKPFPSPGPVLPHGFQVLKTLDWLPEWGLSFDQHRVLKRVLFCFYIVLSPYPGTRNLEYSHQSNYCRVKMFCS